MTWFSDITRNPYIDVALLIDGTGRLVVTSNRIGSEAQRVAAMIRAAEVLARGLSVELGRGDVRSLQLSTQTGHLLVVPVGLSHYLIVLTGRDAPLELIFRYMHRLLKRMPEDEIRAALEMPRSPLEDIDVHELIEAVQEWLHQGGDRANRQRSSDEDTYSS